MQKAYRPFDRNPNALRYRKHPLFHLIGMRGIIAQHSKAEEAMLRKYAKGRRVLVEIGVAEGASALAIRHVADPSGTLYLVDPYPPGRLPAVNLTKMCARMHVGRSRNATVRYLQDYSYNVIKDWRLPIDFLFIDGDHSYEACLQDWQGWGSFVREGGVVAFHDARVFPGGWPRHDWGPVKVVNELFRERRQPGWRLIDEVDSLVVLERV